MIVAVDPGPFLVPDPRLGWTNGPGTHRIRYASGYSYSVSHTASGTRVTRSPSAEARYRGLPRLELYGCSFAYGWSVSDAESFPWRVQAELPAFDLVNYGVGGHGTVQAWLRLEESLARAPLPALVVVTYGSLHDERNVLTRRFRKAIGAYSDQTAGLSAPCARLLAGRAGRTGLVGELRVTTGPLSYERPPLATSSALVELLDEGYARWERAGLREREVTRRLLAEVLQRARAAGVPLVVAGILDDQLTRETLSWLAEQGARTVDISLDLTLPEHTLQPVDWHPSPLAHERYAARLLAYLRAEGLCAP